MSNSILITGGAGFIGSHVIDRLLVEGHEIVCLDNFDQYYSPKIKRANIAQALDSGNLRLVEGDIRDRALLERIISEENINYIIHEAAQAGVRASVKDPRKVHEVNTTGTLNILEAALNFDVKKIINASSSSVYGKVKYLPFDEEHPKNPVSPYGASKLAAEHYCRIFSEVYGMKTVSLRYFTVYGPKIRPDLAVATFTKKALSNEPIEIFGDGSNTRNFTYIDDAIAATFLAMKKGNGEYNVGSNEKISINMLAQKIIKLTGSSSSVVCTQPIAGDMAHTDANILKAKRELNYEPNIDLDEGLKRYVEWYREHLALFKKLNITK